MQMKMRDTATAAERERLAETLFASARAAREARERQWDRFEDYYRGRHGEGELCVTDAFVHVESQIEPEVPDFTFACGDGALTPEQLRRREFAVKHVVDANRINEKNTANERRLLKYGDAFWKVCWDMSRQFAGAADGGDVRVEDVDPREIYPDPAATELQQGEYLFHVYPMQPRKVLRAFGADIARLGENAEQLLQTEGGEGFRAGADCPEICEFYYRTPEDGIALSVFVCGREVRHVPDFWTRTGAQNKRFPFVQYWRIRDERSIWNLSELEQVLPLLDAADRELCMAEKNRAFMANDMLVVEEDALAEGCELTNEPGAILTMRHGRFDRVRRLSGLSSHAESTAMMEHYTAMIERTVGNFDSALGEEPERVVTASGIALLNARADARRAIKRADRLLGFVRLYELIDGFCLEFYDDGRELCISTDGRLGRREGLSDPLRFTYGAGQEQALFAPVECILKGE